MDRLREPDEPTDAPVALSEKRFALGFQLSVYFCSGTLGDKSIRGPVLLGWCCRNVAAFPNSAYCECTPEA